MSGYDDDNETNLVEDEYDDLDDFIVGSDDEGDNVAEEEEDELPEAEEVEAEEEYEEEEEEEPPVGTQEILSFREQLKAKLRKQHQSSGADADGNPSCSSSDQPSVRSRFGTFFGPSTPVLAPRLMEAGCSSMMKENQDVPFRKHAAPSSASKTQQSASTHEQKPKIVPQVKRKVDTLRENRDYSNLFSDDADTPPLTKEDAEKKPVMDPKSDVQAHRMKAMQSTARNNKVPTSHTARPSKDHGSIQRRVENKVFSQVKKEPLPNGRKPNASARNGSRSANGKARPGLQPSSNGQNPQCSIQSKSPQVLPASQRQQQRPLKPQGPRQQNHVPPSPQVRRTNLSVQGQQPAHKGSALPRDRTKLGQKQLAPSSRPKPSPTSAVYGDPAKKKGGAKRKVSDAEKVRQMVRDVLNYDPNKYSHKDKDDDSDMEANYASIQMEERRSAKIARKEDEEEYRLLQEEEQRQRAKKKKQRKES
ncbi:histone H3.v1-like [Hordeum vulgare subsp. vulgare]|uniref:Protein SPT2 homolog n=1 Tax=Hordeum vulgare subsp. vulgare TaxID=112509 RepID=A0A8I7BH71_HORVV|nr:histone H3.v1-like [Hordeum vulgare subsp. vulgare]